MRCFASTRFRRRDCTSCTRRELVGDSPGAAGPPVTDQVTFDPRYDITRADLLNHAG